MMQSGADDECARMRPRGRGREPLRTLRTHQISIDANLLVSITTVSRGTVSPGRALPGGRVDETDCCSQAIDSY